MQRLGGENVWHRIDVTKYDDSILRHVMFAMVMIYIAIYAMWIT